MGTCSCSVLEKPTQFNFGGKLKWLWCEGHKCGRFDAPSRWCNPMNCSNSACKKKGCAQARKNFCSQHGYHCPYMGDKRCWGDPCPGGLKTCLKAPYEVVRYGELPLCGDIPKTPPVVPPGGSSGGGDNRNCSQGNVLACFSEIGVATGNFFRDAAKTGGEQFPLMLMVGAGILLVLLLKK